MRLPWLRLGRFGFLARACKLQKETAVADAVYKQRASIIDEIVLVSRLGSRVDGRPMSLPWLIFGLLDSGGRHCWSVAVGPVGIAS